METCFVNLVEPGDIVVLVAGLPMERPGITNLIKVHCIEGPGKVKEAPAPPTEEHPVTLSTGRCVGCGYCVRLCPFGIFRMEEAGTSVVEEQAAKCAADGQCQEGCPVDAIAVLKR